MIVFPGMIADSITIADFAAHDGGIGSNGAPDQEERRMHVLAFEHLQDFGSVRGIGSVIEGQSNDALRRRARGERFAEDLIGRLLDNFVRGVCSGSEQQQAYYARGGAKEDLAAQCEALTSARACCTFARKPGEPNARNSLTIFS